MLDDLDADNDGVPDHIDISRLDPALPEDGASKLYFEPIGDSVAGAGRNQFFGRYLDMGEDGKTLAVGGLSTVKVLRRKTEGWEQLGASLGTDLGSAQYRRVQLGRHGSNVAVASENFGQSVASGGSGEKSGRVHVYQWATSAWSAQGDPIDGNVPGAMFGSALAMNITGDQIAVGAPGDYKESEEQGSAARLGSVSIFKWSEASGWVPKAQFEGANSKVWGVLTDANFGASVAMSRDAGVIAVGAPGQEDGFVSQSSVHVFKESDEGYVSMGSPINGLGGKEFFGRSVALDQLGGSATDGRHIALCVTEKGQRAILAAARKERGKRNRYGSGAKRV